MEAKGASYATKPRVKSALDINFERKIDNYHREHGIGNYSAAANAAKGQVRTKPVDLREKLAMDEARANPNKDRIMADKISDPRFKGTHDKLTHTHDHGDGTSTEIHGWRDRATGQESGFKFKDAPNNAKSRFDRYK